MKEELTRKVVENIVSRALLEDRAGEDTTSRFTVAGMRGKGVVLARQAGVISGLECCREVYRQLGGVKVVVCCHDGDRVLAGAEILRLEGDLVNILAGERTALNFMGHLSGVASLTAILVDEISSTKAKIYDTRKTIPGLRRLQKYAVTCGGGHNHRFDLQEMALVKDNHRAASGSAANACRQIRENVATEIKIMVEIEQVDDVEPVIAAGADYILLDNMNIAQVSAAVSLNKGRLPLEVSGGVTRENIRKYAETGVDRISIGAITHSVPAFDFSLELTND